MKRNRIELETQKQFINWCWTPQAHRWTDAVIISPRRVRVGNRTIEVKAPTLAFFHVANGEARDRKTGALLHAMGVRRGVFDLWLPVSRSPFCGFVLEVKAPGKWLSPEQKVWNEFLQSQGRKVAVADTFMGCVDATTEYLDGIR